MCLPMTKQPNEQSLSLLLKRLWVHISPRRRFQLCALAFLMALSSFAEALSIGAVIPFLGVLTAPEQLLELPAFKPFARYLPTENAAQLLLPLMGAFCFLSIVSGAFKLLLAWSAARVANSIGGDISVSIYRRTLYQPYLTHISRNSSEIISGISGKANSVVGGTILPIVTILSASLMLTMVASTLLVIEPVVAASAILGLAVCYLLISLIVRKKLSVASHLISKNSTKVIKVMQEALGGIRDIILDQSQEIFVNEFRVADVPLRHAQSSVQLIGVSPRFLLDSLGVVLISTIAIFLAQKPGGIGAAIPVLGALALGAQRLLPLLQQSYQSWASLRAGKSSLSDALDLLEQPMPRNDGFQAGSKRNVEEFMGLELNDVSFRYQSDSEWVLQKLSLRIKKGEIVGIYGASGAGKSTLIDIILGLLQPQHGQLLVNGRPVDSPERLSSWRSMLSHVPQEIYLFDASISENIAFGKFKSGIDANLVRAAADRAQLSSTIGAMSNQYETQVGERGAKLSGGQRQRIGIARALYKQAKFIILDEATSALDSETEKRVMSAIGGSEKDVTILMITHRTETLRHCDAVYRLDEGALKRVAEDFVGQRA